MRAINHNHEQHDHDLLDGAYDDEFLDLYHRAVDYYNDDDDSAASDHPLHLWRSGDGLRR